MAHPACLASVLRTGAYTPTTAQPCLPPGLSRGTSPLLGLRRPPISASLPCPIPWPPLADSEACAVSFQGSLPSPHHTSGHTCAARSLEGLPC